MPQTTHQPDWEKEFSKQWEKLWTQWGESGGYDYNPNANVYIGIGIKEFFDKVLSQEKSKWQAEAREQIHGKIEKYTKERDERLITQGRNVVVNEILYLPFLQGDK